MALIENLAQKERGGVGGRERKACNRLNRHCEVGLAMWVPKLIAMSYDYSHLTPSDCEIDGHNLVIAVSSKAMVRRQSSEPNAVLYHEHFHDSKDFNRRDPSPITGHAEKLTLLRMQLCQ